MRFGDDRGVHNLRCDGEGCTNSNNVLNGFETDAYLIAVTWPNTEDTVASLQLSRWLVAGGSYLRKGGRVFFDSLSKAYMGAARRDDELAISISGQPMIKARVLADWNPRMIRRNGRIAEADTVRRCEETGGDLLTLKIFE